MLRITLEAARRNAGYTQKEVAKALNVSNKTIGRWESYVSSPNMAQACALSALYKIPCSNIIFLPDNSL